MDLLKKNEDEQVGEYIDYYVNLVYLLSDLCMDK